MAIETYEAFVPKIHSSAFIAASADIIGRVRVEQDASVWYNASVRGDINEVVIGPSSNVQDNAVIHLSDDHGTYLGELVTIGHGAIVHAASVKDEVLVGMGSCVLDGVVIGERSIIGANSLLTSGTIVPPGSLVMGSPARVVKTLDLVDQSNVKKWAEKYVIQSRKYMARPNAGKV